MAQQQNQAGSSAYDAQSPDQQRLQEVRLVDIQLPVLVTRASDGEINPAPDHQGRAVHLRVPEGTAISVAGCPEVRIEGIGGAIDITAGDNDRISVSGTSGGRITTTEQARVYVTSGLGDLTLRASNQSLIKMDGRFSRVQLTATKESQVQSVGTISHLEVCTRDLAVVTADRAVIRSLQCHDLSEVYANQQRMTAWGHDRPVAVSAPEPQIGL